MNWTLKTAQNKYYGLVNQQRGLCEGLRVASKEVFFSKEFQDDDLQAGVARRFIKQLKTTLKPDQEDTARDQKERSYVTTYLELPFEDDIKNQVRALAATWEVLPEPWALTEKLTVLNKYNKDTQNAPGATFSGLRRAFSVDLAMEDHDREKAYLLRPLIVEEVRCLLRHPDSTSNLADILQGAINHVRLQFGTKGEPSFPAAVGNPEKWHRILKAIICHIKQILDYGTAYGDAIRQSLGGQALGHSHEEIFHLFSKCVDIDAAQLYIREMYPRVLIKLLAKDQGVMDKLKAYVTHLSAIDSLLDQRAEGKDVEEPEEMHIG
ncbi:MAG: hypothetical protein Q9204_002623 [Flavoplaca sp. TL-2023a]